MECDNKGHPADLNATVLLTETDVDSLEQEIMSLCHAEFFHPDGEHAQKYDELIQDVMNLCNDGPYTCETLDLNDSAVSVIPNETKDSLETKDHPAEFLGSPITPGRFKGVAKVRHNTSTAGKYAENDDDDEDNCSEVAISLLHHLDKEAPEDVSTGSHCPSTSQQEELNTMSQDSFLANIDDMVVIDEYCGESTDLDEPHKGTQQISTAQEHTSTVYSDCAETTSSTIERPTFLSPGGRMQSPIMQHKQTHGWEVIKEDRPVELDLYPDSDDSLLDEMSGASSSSRNIATADMLRVSESECESTDNTGALMSCRKSDEHLDKLVTTVNSGQRMVFSGTSLDESPNMFEGNVLPLFEDTHQVLSEGVDKELNCDSENSRKPVEHKCDLFDIRAAKIPSACWEDTTEKKSNVFQRLGPSIDRLKTKLIRKLSEKSQTSPIEEPSRTGGETKVSCLVQKFEQADHCLVKQEFESSHQVSGIHTLSQRHGFNPTDWIKKELKSSGDESTKVEHLEEEEEAVKCRDQLKVRHLVQKFEEKTCKETQAAAEISVQDKKDEAKQHLPNLRRMTVEINQAKAKFVVMKWGSEGIPNPEVNLTCATYLRRKTSLKGVMEIGLLEGDHHYASKLSTYSTASRKRKLNEVEQNECLPEDHPGKKVKLNPELSKEHQEQMKTWQSQIDETARKKLEDIRDNYDSIMRKISFDEQQRVHEVQRVYASRFRNMQGRHYHELNRLSRLPYNSVTNARYFQLQRRHYEERKDVEKQKDGEYDSISAKFKRLFRAERERLVKQNEEVLEACNLQKAATSLFLPDVQYVELDVSGQRDKRCRTEKSFLPQDIAEAIMEEEKLYDFFYAN